MTQAPLAPLPVLTADMTFDGAARMVLRYLEDNVPLALWGITRVENGNQTFLHLSADNPYGLGSGSGHRWEDSFCVRMAAGEAPAVAPDAQSVPEYAAAGVNDNLEIGAYAGAPIYEPAGSVFGAICGIDPENKSLDQVLASAGPVLALLGQMLSMAVAMERVREQAAAMVLEATLAAETDALTGLYNRRAWDRILSEEERRFASLADPTIAVVLDLDLLKDINDTEGHAAGDEYIRRAGQALLGSVKTSDAVARLGGDEFGVLLRHCTEEDAVDVVARMYEALATQGVAGSIGWAPITVMKGFPAALAEADAAMYAAKAARRDQRRAHRRGEPAR